MRISGGFSFSVSIGMGIMITYESYLSKRDILERNTVIIPIADTIVALMAGIAVMPAVFAMGMKPSEGPGLLFRTLHVVFGNMGAVGFFVFGASLAVLSVLISVDGLGSGNCRKLRDSVGLSFLICFLKEL